MLRRVLIAALTPIVRLMRRMAPVEDPWMRVESPIAITAERVGSAKDFGWYFEGRTTRTARSVDDLRRWLSQCSYVSDVELFRENDFWQHPCTFERLQSGDCEDFALYAWRQLLELGLDADFVVGRCCVAPVTGEVLARFSGHAWVLLRREGKTYVFEPTLGARRKALQELDLVRHLYVPEFGVGGDRVPYAFGGFLMTAEERDRRPREADRA